MIVFSLSPALSPPFFTFNDILFQYKFYTTTEESDKHKILLIWNIEGNLILLFLKKYAHILCVSYITGFESRWSDQNSGTLIKEYVKEMGKMTFFFFTKNKLDSSSLFFFFQSTAVRTEKKRQVTLEC